MSYPERLRGFNAQLRNVERVPLVVGLSESCCKEDMQQPSRVQYLYLCLHGRRREVFLKGLEGVISLCFLLEDTSHPLVLLQGRPFTPRGLFGSSLWSLGCISCCAGHTRNTFLSRLLTDLSALLNPTGKRCCQVMQCLLQLHLRHMMDTAAALGCQLPVVDPSLGPVPQQWSPLPS